MLEVLRNDAWVRKAGGRQAGSDQPRAYSVDANSIRSPLICSGPDESEQARLAGVVGDEISFTVERVRGRDYYNRTLRAVFIRRPAICKVWKAPLKFTASVRFHKSGVVSATDESRPIPAFTTRTSGTAT